MSASVVRHLSQQSDIERLQTAYSCRHRASERTSVYRPYSSESSSSASHHQLTPRCTLPNVAELAKTQERRQINAKLVLPAESESIFACACTWADGELTESGELGKKAFPIEPALLECTQPQVFSECFS
jgi:hypothetical protein